MDVSSANLKTRDTSLWLWRRWCRSPRSAGRMWDTASSMHIKQDIRCSFTGLVSIFLLNLLVIYKKQKVQTMHVSCPHTRMHGNYIGVVSPTIPQLKRFFKIILLKILDLISLRCFVQLQKPKSIRKFLPNCDRTSADSHGTGPMHNALDYGACVQQTRSKRILLDIWISNIISCLHFSNSYLEIIISTKTTHWETLV